MAVIGSCVLRCWREGSNLVSWRLVGAATLVSCLPFGGRFPLLVCFPVGVSCQVLNSALAWALAPGESWRWACRSGGRSQPCMEAMVQLPCGCVFFGAEFDVQSLLILLCQTLKHKSMKYALCSHCKHLFINLFPAWSIILCTFKSNGLKNEFLRSEGDITFNNKRNLKNLNGNVFSCFATFLSTRRQLNFVFAYLRNQGSPF